MNLREFIQAEMFKRHMSAREFARFVGVSHGTINNQLDFNSEVEPSLSLLHRLSKATQISICDLIAMVYPDTASASPYANVLAQYIERLPNESREIIDNYIRGKAIETLKESQKSD